MIKKNCLHALLSPQSSAVWSPLPETGILCHAVPALQVVSTGGASRFISVPHAKDRTVVLGASQCRDDLGPVPSWL